jgi:hypothetical protein
MFNRRLVVMAATLLLASVACGTIAEPPGEGAKAEEGYQLSEPIITALESYHADNSDSERAAD